MATTATPVSVPPHSYDGPEEPPFVLPDTVDVHADIEYATAFDQKWQLDLFTPLGRATATGVSRAAPAVIYLHGGGGNRQKMWRHAAHMAARGFIGISAEHAAARPHPPRPLAELLELPQAAVRWLRARANELGVDPLRMGAVGGSSSGRLVASLGGVDAPEGGLSSRVQAVVIMKGGVRAQLASLSAAPTLLIHGEGDPKVPYELTVAYGRALQEMGVRCELLNEPTAVHSLKHRAPYYERCLPIMERFLITNLV